MKTDEVKSKFVYPDKLYARTNNNITLDISYAPLILEAVEYVRTDAFIEKAVKWLEDNAINYWGTDAVDNGKMMLDFKIAMRLWN